MNLFLMIVLAAGLPGFAEFQRIDRQRRATGQQMTEEWLRASRVEPALIVRTAEQRPDLLWGAAELLQDWPQQRAMFERALAASGTNTGIAVRFACAAAKQGDADTAMPWLRESQQRDADNTAPWLAELWLLQKRGRPLVLSNSPPQWATNFRDYSLEASRARIRLLETAGYSPYAARRLGLSADSPALTMARDLAVLPINEVTSSLLRDTAQSLQRRPPLLLWELVGQRIEVSLLTLRRLKDTSGAPEQRAEELEERREELMQLVADVERNVVPLATEAQMVQYFDDLLDKGEETAMKRLAEAVRGKP
jgi:hypothetical protein